MQTNDPPPRPRPFQVRRAQDLGVAVKHYRTLAGLRVSVAPEGP